MPTFNVVYRTVFPRNIRRSTGKTNEERMTNSARKNGKVFENGKKPPIICIDIVKKHSETKAESDINWQKL